MGFIYGIKYFFQGNLPKANFSNILTKSRSEIWILPGCADSDWESAFSQSSVHMTPHQSSSHTSGGHQVPCKPNINTIVHWM